MMNNSQRQKESEDKTKFPSISVSFDIARERVQTQMSSISALDTKISFLLGAATVVVGTALSSQNTLLSTHYTNLTERILRGAPLLLALVMYLAVLLAGFRAYLVRPFPNAPDLEILYKHYLDKTEHNVKAMIFRALVEAYKSNKDKIGEKARWTNFALFALMGEALVLILAIGLRILIG